MTTTPDELRRRAHELVAAERSRTEQLAKAYLQTAEAAAVALEGQDTPQIWAALTAACTAEFDLTGGDCDVTGRIHEEHKIPDCYVPEPKRTPPCSAHNAEDDYCTHECALCAATKPHP